MNSLRDLCDTIKHINIHVMSPKRKGRKEQKKLEEIVIKTHQIIEKY